MKKWIILSVIVVFTLIAFVVFSCNRSDNTPKNLAVKDSFPQHQGRYLPRHEVVVKSAAHLQAQWSFPTGIDGKHRTDPGGPGRRQLQRYNRCRTTLDSNPGRGGNDHGQPLRRKRASLCQ